ncbi:MAG: hypothetical protein AAB617_01290 [Patescibacteria group bacterium]
MSKTNKILLVAVVILVVVIVFLTIWMVWFKSPNYYAVYMRTGDLYFGKLVRFPHFGLKNVYTLQVNQQDQQNPIRIQKFTNVFWGPEDYLKLNDDEVVWVTKLKSDGQLAQVIKNNPDLLPTEPQQAVPAGAPAK